MKPTNDIFEQQVRGLYEGYEVPAPASTKDAVFNELDSASPATSGSFARKPLLIAASLLTVGAIYVLTNDTPPTQCAPEAIEVVEAPVVVEAPESSGIIEVVVSEAPADEAPTVIESEVIEKVEDSTGAIEPVVEEVVIESPVAIEEIKEVAPPVEVVEPVAKETPAEEEKEEVEWVLPATIKVEK